MVTNRLAAPECGEARVPQTFGRQYHEPPFGRMIRLLARIGCLSTCEHDKSLSTMYSKASSFRNRGVEAPALISKIEGEIELPPALNFLDFNPQNAKFSRACGAPALISKSAGGIELKTARRISIR